MMSSQPQGLLKMLNSSEHINTSWAELKAAAMDILNLLSQDKDPF